MTAPHCTIIPRTAHPISRRNLSDNAVKALYRLRDNGFRAVLVGGCIRDLLLGREPKDFDIATNATPSQVKKLFRNCRLVGRRFRLAHLHFRDEIIEVATFRSASSDGDEPDDAQDDAGRPPRVVKDEGGMILRDNLFGTPEEDAWRRDFTVNALSYDIADFSLVDYVGGLDDLNNGVIRTIGDPKVRFAEDPVRMLRAIRFAALLGFDIEPVTWEALTEMGHLCANASPPRLYEEMLKLFGCGEGERCYQLLRQSGIFAALFPGVNAWLGTETDGFPHVRFGRMLEIVDAQTSAGNAVAPHLLLALLFGEYLEEQSSALRNEGLSSQEAVDAAVAVFMGELAPIIKVPHKVALGMRGILLAQRRFTATPGRRPLSFITRPGFVESLRFLELTAEFTDEAKTLFAWWTKYLAKNPPPVVTGEQSPDANPDGSGAPRRRRRNRRRRRSSAPSNNSTDS